MTDQLVEALQFKRDEMGQFLIVGPLLAVLAMSGVAVILSAAERGRLRSVLLTAFLSATLVFIFATSFAAIILPGMGWAAAHNISAQIPGFLTLTRIVVYSMLLGVIILVAAIGLLGLIFSRRAGIASMIVAGLTVAAFTACAFYLDHVARL